MSTPFDIELSAPPPDASGASALTPVRLANVAEQVAERLVTAISLGEFGATSFLSRSGGETMPIAIERLLGRTGSVLQAQGFALATLLAATTVILVVIVERLQSPRTAPSR